MSTSLIWAAVVLLLVLLVAFVVRQVRLMWLSDRTTTKLTLNAELRRWTLHIEREQPATTSTPTLPAPSVTRSRRRARRRRREPM